LLYAISILHTSSLTSPFLLPSSSPFFFSMPPPPPRSTLFPYTTLFRSRLKTTEGVFSKVTDSLELYRVKDLETRQPFWLRMCGLDRKSTRLNSSHVKISYAVFCLKKKKKKKKKK